MSALHIDKEFEQLIPPLSAQEYHQLRENLLIEGCRDAIVIWNNTVIDGHNRIKICRQEKIDFKTVEKKLKDRAEVKEWIVKNQFGRRNINAYQRCLLALKLFGFFKEKADKNLISSGKHYGKGFQISGNPMEKVNTHKELAKIAGVSHDTIAKGSMSNVRCQM